MTCENATFQHILEFTHANQIFSGNRKSAVIMVTVKSDESMLPDIKKRTLQPMSKLTV